MSLSRPNFGSCIGVSDSALVKYVKYDPSTNVLDAKLKNGRTYRYRGVNDWVFARLVTAKSTGKAFNRLLKNWKFRRLPLTAA